MEVDQFLSGLISPSFGNIGNIGPVGADTIAEDEEIEKIEQLYSLGNLSVVEGSYSSAVKYFTEALEIDHNSKKVLIGRATAYLREGDMEKVINDAKTLMQSLPEDVDAQSQGRFLLACAYESQGDYQQSLENLLKLHLQNPQYPEVESQIMRLATKILKSNEEFEYESFPALLQTLADKMFNKSLLSPAQSIIEFIIHQEVNVPNEVLIKSLLTGARILLAIDDKERAILTYQECILRSWKLNLSSTESEARRELAELYFNSGDFFQAAFALEKYLCLLDLIGSSDPNSSDSFWSTEKITKRKLEAHFKIAESFLKIGEVELAQKHAKSFSLELESAFNMEINAGNKFKLLNLKLVAEVNRSCGMFTEALQSALEYLELLRKSEENIHEALLFVGLLYMKTKFYQSAEETFSECSRLSLGASKTSNLKHSHLMNLYISLYSLGKSLFKQEKIDKATDAFSDCLKQCKSVGNDRTLECKCLMKLADCSLRKGKSSQAVYYLQCALELQKDLPEDLYQTCLAKSASVMQHSATHSELVRANKLLDDLLPKFWDRAFESFVKSNRFEGKEFQLLSDISNARVHILVKLGFIERALLACESFRGFKFDAMFRQKCELLPSCHKNYIKKLEKEVSLDSLLGCLSSHGTPAIYLHLRESYLFVWVLHPQKGLLLFHRHTVESSERSLSDILSDYRDIFASRNSGLYHFENRMISDCKQPFKLLPKRNSESDSKEAKLLSDLCHFVFEPLKAELSKLKCEKITLIGDGLLSVVPLSDMFQNFWGRKLSSRSPVFELVSSLSMLQWILEFTGKSDAVQGEPISPEAGLNVTIPPSSSLETSFPKRNVEQPSPAKAGTANIMGWASLTEGTGVGPGSQGNTLKEVPLLQYKRQIQSAGGDQNDIANMYRGTYTAAEKYNDVMTAAAAQMLDNESLRTDASSLRRHPYSTSSVKASANDKSPVSKLSKQNKPTEKSSASPNLSQQRPSLASDQLSESETGSVTIDKTQAEKNAEKIEGSFSTLVTQTWKGKTIKDSKIALESYNPKGPNKIFRFLGAPVLPEKICLDRFTWKPTKVLKLAQEELNEFANFFKTTAIIGELCTKSEALKLLQRSFCVHLATYVNFENCEIAFTPELPYQKMNSIKADAAVANIRDLFDLDLSSVELLVLSSFPSQKHPNPESFTNLLVLLISLGVKCIVYPIQAVPLNAVKKFFGYFYRAIRKIEPACSVSAALKYAKEHIQKDPKLASPENWQCFQMFGVDVQIKGNEIIHDMLDDIVDHVETAQEHDYFNIPEPVQALDAKSDLLLSLRNLVADILSSHMKELEVVQSLQMLVSQAIGQLHSSPDNSSNMCRLQDPRVIKSQAILSFLHFLRFDFQPYGCSDLKEDFDHPVVLWPHWNKDELLHPSLEILKNISLVRDNITLLEELVNVLKFSEGKEEAEGGDLVSLLIDVLSLSEHAPEVQMYMTDVGVKKVWQCAPSRRLMTSLGFHQVGLSLSPYRNLANTRYQQCVLRILCALSGVKGEAMVGKVDASYLADQKQSLKSGDDSSSMMGDGSSFLTGPTSNLRIPIQWRLDTSSLSPNEVKSLAHAINSIKVGYKQNISSIMAKHRAYLAEHAETWIDETWGVTAVRCEKVKVAPGGTPSTTLRVQLHPPPHIVPTIEDTDVQREYSQYLVQWRAADVARYRHHDIRALLFNRLASKSDTV